ncbi:isochorismatase family protein [Nocardia takedensis]
MFGGIPDVISYAMPKSDELPSNMADWKLTAERSALLVHDMQGYFLRSLAAGGAPYAELVDNIVALRAACVRAGVPVCYTVQPGGMTREQRGLLRDFWGVGMSKDAVDRDVVAELAPVPGDRMFTKWRYSAFHASDLLEWLRGGRRDQLIVTGVYAHVGVLATAGEAYAHDIETFLAADAVADFTRADHDFALRYAAARCAVVRTTRELTDALTDESTPVPTSA